MARRGEFVDESVECVGIGSGEAIDRLLAVAASEYRAVNVGANRFQFARTYRPTWAVTLAIVLFPLAPLFLLVRSTETWAATVEEDHRRVRVRLNGPILAPILLALRGALSAGPHAMVAPPAAGLVADPVAVPQGLAAPPGFGSPVVAPPTALTPPPAVPPVVTPTAPPGATTISAPPLAPVPPMPPSVPFVPPVPVDVPAHPAPDVSPPVPTPAQAVPLPPPDPGPRPSGEATLLVKPSDPQVQPVDPGPVPGGEATGAVGPATVLTFDTGEIVPVPALLLVGRDPQPAEGEADAVLLPVADPDMSVSKTHISVGKDDRGIWVVDRGSTNGTVIEAPGAPARTLESGVEASVEPGSTVRFGQRSFVVAVSSGVPNP